MARQRVSHRQVAQWLGKSQPQITRRLSGTIAFDTAELEVLAQALGVPVRQFFPAASAA
jgi:transcriptional regulator with XRE-family HTH domain